MKKGVKITLISIALIVVLLGVMTSLAFSKINYKKWEGDSTEVISKIRDGEKTGKEVEINNEELNEALSIMYKNPIKKGGIIINTPEGFLEDNYVGVKIPVIYKNKEIVIYTKGEIDFVEDKIEYTPKSFKVGKLPIPKSLIFNSIKKYELKGIEGEEGKVLIDKKLVPFSISSLDVREGILYIKLNKFVESSLFDNEKNVKIELDKIKNQLEEVKSKSKDENEKSKIDNIINKIEDNKERPTKDIVDKIKEDIKEVGKDSKDEESKKEIDKAVDDIEKSKKEKVDALINVRGQLSNALGSTGSSGGEEIIGIMLSTIDKLIQDPSYNYGGNVGSVKKIYGKLSGKEKKAVKDSIFSNVDGASIGEVRRMFGL
ncbi:hypothetical protein KQI86_15765 [Clostridium sp. MSJ-11]|uniref:Uncharacterized protein n=1 Tax=Clostridium mobile TaxID=2841512 RepID=A0ABS6EKN0_9CLOT|nr:hypothetical protein [Clostridium mobile]MBU5485777.1 hypothetical protein [Clostridium mobile]